jgi:hypothetical protein
MLDNPVNDHPLDRLISGVTATSSLSGRMFATTRTKPLDRRAPIIDGSKPHAADGVPPGSPV